MVNSGAKATRPVEAGDGDGNRLIVEPMPRPSLLDLLATWEPLDEEFPEIEDLESVEDVNL